MYLRQLLVYSLIMVAIGATLLFSSQLTSYASPDAGWQRLVAWVRREVASLGSLIRSRSAALRPAVTPSVGPGASPATPTEVGETQVEEQSHLVREVGGRPESSGHLTVLPAAQRLDRGEGGKKAAAGTSLTVSIPERWQLRQPFPRNAAELPEWRREAFAQWADWGLLPPVDETATSARKTAVTANEEEVVEDTSSEDESEPEDLAEYFVELGIVGVAETLEQGFVEFPCHAEGVEAVVGDERRRLFPGCAGVMPMKAGGDFLDLGALGPGRPEKVRFIRIRDHDGNIEPEGDAGKEGFDLDAVVLLHGEPDLGGAPLEPARAVEVVSYQPGRQRNLSGWLPQLPLTQVQRLISGPPNFFGPGSEGWQEAMDSGRWAADRLPAESVVSLGHGGAVVLKVRGGYLRDGRGPDLQLFENPFKVEKKKSRSFSIKKKQETP